jgi:mannose-6-phosphate isomerase-like protein (cupin superfamily)
VTTDPANDPTSPQATVVRYERPDTDRDRAVKVQGHTDRMLVATQFLRSGGESNLHAHRTLDGFWFVLAGRARFYTTDDELVAELGPHEGIIVPRDYPYWFESAGDEPLELLQVEASNKPVTQLTGFGEERVDYTPLTEKMRGVIADTTAKV